MVVKDLQGRVAVVTGGAGGLGRAISERLGAAGAEVTITDHPAALPKNGMSGIPIDLADAEAEQRLAELAGSLGPVDIVVANAGIVPPWRGFGAFEREEWHHVMTVNVWGVAATIGAFASSMARSGRGSIVVMGSINGYKAHAKQALYTASKHAVLGVMRAAALDLGPKGIRVNALAPGPIATPALLARIDGRHSEGGPPPPDVLDALAEETALGRLATMDDVAAAAHFLASDASAGMTGAVLPIEAGLG